MKAWFVCVWVFLLAGLAGAGDMQPAWRGLHVDVSRHFFEPAVLRQFMDEMAALRFNRLHLHLTDGPGWRLESLRYPRLTSVGAWRKKLPEGDWNWRDHEIGSHFTTCYGGYYTQEEMRGLIAYGAARGIMLVPEVDLPGHAYAALVAYPELALEPPPGCKLGRDVLAVENPRVRRFAREVLDEIMELFPPGTPIHLGGDEVDTQLLTREQQRVFMQEMVDYVSSRGYPAITWDEAAENGVRGQWVMLWRAEKMEEILALGLPTILCPNSHFYFDYPQRVGVAPAWQRVITPETVRSFRLPQAAHVLGLQANLWSEDIKTPARLFEMAFPRARVMAETFWLGAQGR
ncbi:MAG: family 20 glycosylhydrolase [Akkermansia sp.]|nr:family 20 glycosylhydrolase [Akkermansia sp.]MBQ8376845.1 family 20 glycosylhydrolase [Akkermansia sp.]